MDPKQANAPIAAQIVAALLGASLIGSDQEHVEALRSQAALLNEAARELEARKMEQTIRGLSLKMASAGETVSGLVKVAAAATVANGDMVKLAWLLEQEGMDKEAIGALIGGLARAGGAALKGLGGVAQAAGRLRMPTTGTQRLLQAGGEALQAPGRFAGNTAKMLHAGGETAATVGAAKGPGVLQRAGGWLQGKGQSLHQAGAAAAPAAAAPIAAAAAPAATAAAPAASKPMLSMGTKAKLLGGGALLGAGYLGMKGLQAGRDYMMQPSGSQHGPPVMNNVNQYGYPQY